MTPEGHPPRVLETLAALLLPASLRNEILGDLRERFSGIASARGRRAAVGWYVRQLLALRPWRLERQARRAGLGTRPRVRGRGGDTSWILDLRHAARSLRKRSGASLTVMATVALAIGATTAVFTVVDGVLLAPLPFPDSDRLLRIWQTKADWTGSPRPQLQRLAERFPFSIPEFDDLQAQSHAFSAMGAFVQTSLTLTEDGHPELVRGESMTSGVFRALGVQPVLGRHLVPDDDRPGAPPVIVLSYGTWRDRFASDPGIVGRGLHFDEGTRTVVGVMPAGFTMPEANDAFWTSVPDKDKTGQRDNRSYRALGRLAPGSTLPAARSEQATVMKAMADAYPDSRGDIGGRLESLLDSVVGRVRATLWLLLGAVALVLAIACVNIANVLSVVGISRGRELAVRAALGASAGRLARAQLVESLLLIGTGGAAGVVLAALSLPLLAGLLPPDLPRRAEVAMSGGVMMFGLGVTALTALAVGLVPTLQAGRVHPAHSIREAGRAVAGGSSPALQSAFVVTEVALAFVLLVGAGLLGNSFERLWHVDRGFDTAGIAVVTLLPDEVRYPDTAARLRLADQLRARLAALPGVEVTGASQVPLSGSASSTDFLVQRRAAAPDTAVGVFISAVVENYFSVMRIPVVQGRGFQATDVADGAPVAIVNEAMAREYWPEESPLGRQVRHKGDDDEPWMTVVGVVRNVRHVGLDTPVEPKVYAPRAQSDRWLIHWVLRTGDNLPGTLELARGVIAEVAPDTPIWRTVLLEEHIASSVAVPRFRAWFVMGLAAMAAILALLGVYGVTSFAASQRTREIGVRIALGSGRGAVLRHVMRGGLRLTTWGLLLGLGVALPATRLVSGFLFGIRATDPTTFGVAVALVTLVSAMAAWLPARKASRIDPMRVLNAE